MSKIIGVTVGTPTSPSKIAKEIKPVKTVNGKSPNETGDVTLEIDDVDVATDEEVTKVLENIYGEPMEDLPEDEIPLVDSDFATDKEVKDMLNDVFGT